MNRRGTEKRKQPLRQIVLASFTAALCVAFSVGAEAAASITVDNVAQRWPWNNKIDITYTIGEGTDLASGTYYKAVFIANIGGQICEIDGSKDLLAKTTTGQHTVTWTNAPAGVKAMDCRVGATHGEATKPSEASAEGTGDGERVTGNGNSG